MSWLHSSFHLHSGAPGREGKNEGQPWSCGKKSIFGSKEIAIAGILAVIEPLANHMRLRRGECIGNPATILSWLFRFLDVYLSDSSVTGSLLLKSKMSKFRPWDLPGRDHASNGYGRVRYSLRMWVGVCGRALHCLQLCFDCALPMANIISIIHMCLQNEESPGR